MNGVWIKVRRALKEHLGRGKEFTLPSQVGVNANRGLSIQNRFAVYFRGYQPDQYVHFTNVMKERQSPLVRSQRW